jgi:adenylate cyclase
MGYYFTSEGDGRTNGAIPAPVTGPEFFQGRRFNAIGWTGYGANLDNLAKAAPLGGFFNAITEDDGVVRSLRLLAGYRRSYYES